MPHSWLWLLLLLLSELLPPPRRPGAAAGCPGREAGGTGLPRASVAAAADRLGGAVSALSLAWGAFLTAALWGSPATLPHKEQSLLSHQLHVQTLHLCGGAGSVGLLGASFATLGRCFRSPGWPVRSAPSCSEPKGGTHAFSAPREQPSLLHEAPHPWASFIQHPMLTPVSPKSRRNIWLVLNVVLLKISQPDRGKESACQCRRPRLDPWVGKIP